MHDMQVKIYTLGETWFNDSAYGVTAPAVSGDIEVLSGHTYFMTTLRMGPLIVKQHENESIFFVSGGILHVLNNEIIILASEALHAKDLDEKAALEARQLALDKIQSQKQSVNYSEVLHEIALAREQLRVIRLAKANDKF